MEQLLNLLRKKYPLKEQSVDPCREVKASGMRFTIRAYEAEGLGHVSVMHAVGFLGLMKMDSLIINPTAKDLPLYSYDRIFAMGNDTLIVEIYDTLIAPSDFSGVEKVKQAYSDLPDHVLGAHWYDSIKLPISVSKKAKKNLSGRFSEFAEKHLAALLEIEPDHACDAAAKLDKASVYVEGLLKNGGPSTDVFLKALGQEKTEWVFRSALFGTIQSL